MFIEIPLLRSKHDWDVLPNMMKQRITNHVQLTTPETIPMPNDTTSFCVPTPLVQKN